MKKKPKREEPKVLDIKDQFAAHVKSLLASVDAGKKVHRTANIAESGQPFKKHFRSLFSEALPPVFSVVPGYFFNSELNISSQVDALICDRSEVLQLPPTNGLAQHYVPYNSVRVMAQVKNHASGLREAIEQTADAIRHWRKMRRKIWSLRRTQEE